MTTAVVTGIGVVAPNGLGVADYWSAVLRGQPAIRPIPDSTFPVRLAGQVVGFQPDRHLPGRLVPQTDRMTQFAITAADSAVQDATLDLSGFDPLTVGVVTAGTSGGFSFGQRELANLCYRGPDHVSAYMSFAWFYAVNSGQISIRHNLRGPTGVLVADQAGGLDALAHARRKLRQGTRLVLTGGLEAPLCPYSLTAQLAGGRLSERADPATAYLPFDVRAGGHVPGEGGAILVLEDRAQAGARGAAVYGEIAGYGATTDPHPDAGRPSNLRRAIELALADAGLDPADVAVVFADAAAVPELDRAEARALAEVFGPRGVPVTVPKAAIGRLYSGGGPLDVVAALLALRKGVIPPTVNVTQATVDRTVDLVEAARPLTGSAALVLARGVGGFNSALVVSTRDRGGR